MMLQQGIANGIHQCDAPVQSMVNGQSVSSNGAMIHSLIVDRTVQDVFLASPMASSRINTGPETVILKFLIDKVTHWQ